MTPEMIQPLSIDYLEEQLKWIESDRYCRSLIESNIAALKKLESITCLCAEGVEFMTRTELAEAILKIVGDD